MESNLQPVRGTKDLIDEDFIKHKHVIDVANKIAVNYGYKNIITPIFEFAEVFNRTLGETADIVTKEMYSFVDKGGDLITLRPEFTASIARSFISNGLSHKLPLKFFSTGPLFRYERPQKGRLRQFHQINFESLGISSPIHDAEIIAMGCDILQELKILDFTVLQINSLGDKESRENYHKILVEYFKDFYDDLSDDSKFRLEKNPLRILDSKDEGDKRIILNAPICHDFYTKQSKEFFEQVTQNLDFLKIKYTINSRLVRGLDYYNHTAFEFVTDKLGAQGTVLAGGRYDNLIELMGGNYTPAIGFAAGIERLVDLSSIEPVMTRSIAIITISAEELPYALELAIKLRQQNLIIDIIYDGDAGKKLKKAIKNNASHIIFIGSEEIKDQAVKIRDLDNRNETIIAISQIKNYFNSNS